MEIGFMELVIMFGITNGLSFTCGALSHMLGKIDSKN